MTISAQNSKVNSRLCDYPSKQIIYLKHNQARIFEYKNLECKDFVDFTKKAHSHNEANAFFENSIECLNKIRVYIFQSLIFGGIVVLLQKKIALKFEIENSLYRANLTGRFKNIHFLESIKIPEALIYFGVFLLVFLLIVKSLKDVGKFFTWLNLKQNRSKERDEEQEINDRKWENIVRSEKILRDRKKEKEQANSEFALVKRDRDEQETKIEKMKILINMLKNIKTHKTDNY